MVKGSLGEGVAIRKEMREQLKWLGHVKWRYDQKLVRSVMELRANVKKRDKTAAFAFYLRIDFFGRIWFALRGWRPD